MAGTKRTAEPTEGTRRSTRSGGTDQPAAPAKKVAAPKKAPAAKKAAAVKEPEVEAEPEPEPEKVEDEAEKEPASKKAKSSVTAVGEVVDDVKLHNEDGEEVSFKDLYSESGLVLFSYPKASTPGCTTQACGFRDHYDEITAAGYQVFGISADSPKSQLTFKTKQKMQYSLLSDPKGELLKAIGWSEKTKRCHWIIEKDGKLLEAKLGVKPADDPKNALAFIKAL